MLTQDFERNIQRAQQHIDLINRCYTDLSKPAQEILTQTISELYTSLEELHIAQEELQQQNEELIATRQELEQQRQRYQDLFEFAPEGYLVTDTVVLTTNYFLLFC
ncbi:MAG: hypothetical protein QNJ41_29525 [Xenococcaceae cyanobacterium MO_188.B32]|nr:hypothetical protein [Xenococcaceae cyanobacterium MO_188.B32]